MNKELFKQGVLGFFNDITPQSVDNFQNAKTEFIIKQESTFKQRTMGPCISKLTIYNYWKNWLDENEIPSFIFTIGEELVTNDGYNHAKKLYWCFACGRQGHVEKCHIVPYNGGDNDTVDNLHLLCPLCHKESEVLSGDAYFDWIKNKESYFNVVSKRVSLFFEFLKEKKMYEMLIEELSGIGNDMESKTVQLRNENKKQGVDDNEKEKKVLSLRNQMFEKGKKTMMGYYKKYNPQYLLTDRNVSLCP